MLKLRNSLLLKFHWDTIQKTLISQKSCAILAFDKSTLSSTRVHCVDLITQEFHEPSIFSPLDERASAYIAKARAENTKKAYQSDWSDFEEWCHAHGLQSLPADTMTVVRYITDRATNEWSKPVSKGRGKNKVLVQFKGLKAASIDRKLISIGKAHQFAGLKFDRKHPALKELLSGIKREKGTQQSQKTPLLIDDLRLIFKNMKDDLKGARDKALLLLGFVGALRRSEIVSLQHEDVKFVREGIEITLRKSKTDQEGRCDVIPIPYGSHLLTCPIRALQKWLEVSAITSGPLFRSIDRHNRLGHQEMSPASVALIIKRNIPEEKQHEYSGHSLRAGFCTQAAKNGVQDTLGMRHSRHKKFDTWKKYVRLATVWEENAASKLGL